MEKHRPHIWVAVASAIGVLFLFFFVPMFFNVNTTYTQGGEEKGIKNSAPVKAISKFFSPSLAPLDTVAYDKKMNELANNPPPPGPTTKIVSTKNPDGTVTKTTVEVPAKPAPVNIWPVKAPYPLPGAILPFNRIIAYYGNLYSKKMGVLGEYPEDVMFAKLKAEVAKWQAADPDTKTIPALHYIVVTAQGSAGADGKYRLRMPDSEVDKVIAMADKINAIVFLDIQVGLSDLQSEIPRFEKYWKMPQVHMGIDPEFSMKTGAKPGKVVGTYDAADVNYATQYLAKIVKENELTPKVLVIHRYTQKMLTNYQNIKPLPEVQIVMHMDGWGGKAKKEGTYRNFVYKEPVQFTGYKIFYKNDVFDPGTVVMSPTETLKLRPIPSYIQYQ